MFDGIFRIFRIFEVFCWNFQTAIREQRAIQKWATSFHCKIIEAVNILDRWQRRQNLALNFRQQISHISHLAGSWNSNEWRWFAVVPIESTYSNSRQSLAGDFYRLSTSSRRLQQFDDTHLQLSIHNFIRNFKKYQPALLSLSTFQNYSINYSKFQTRPISLKWDDF